MFPTPRVVFPVTVPVELASVCIWQLTIVELRKWAVVPLRVGQYRQFAPVAPVQCSRHLGDGVFGFCRLAQGGPCRQRATDSPRIADLVRASITQFDPVVYAVTAGAVAFGVAVYWGARGRRVSRSSESFHGLSTALSAAFGRSTCLQPLSDGRNQHQEICAAPRPVILRISFGPSWARRARASAAVKSRSTSISLSPPRLARSRSIGVLCIVSTAPWQLRGPRAALEDDHELKYAKRTVWRSHDKLRTVLRAAYGAVRTRQQGGSVPRSANAALLIRVKMPPPRSLESDRRGNKPF